MTVNANCVIKPTRAKEGPTAKSSHVKVNHINEYDNTRQ